MKRSGRSVRRSSLRRGRGWWGIDHNRKGGAFEIEQPKVGPEGELSGGERVKGQREHGGNNRCSVAFLEKYDDCYSAATCSFCVTCVSCGESFGYDSIQVLEFL